MFGKLISVLEVKGTMALYTIGETEEITITMIGTFNTPFNLHKFTFETHWKFKK